MITPPEYRIDWREPTYRGVIDRRKRNYDLITKNKDGLFRAGLVTFYKTHPVEFINDWVVTFDPREIHNPFIPMILFPKQAELVRWLYNLWLTQEDGLVEKSRDVGMTWIAMAFSVWLWLFHPGQHIGFGSYKQDKVDKIGDLDSILEKGRMLLRYLPEIWWPQGFHADSHCMFLKFINPENGSTITGEAGDNIGRGGRASIYFKDESAHYERPEKIEASLSATANCKIDMSSVNGMGNPFYQKRHSGHMNVFVFDWRDDPRKDEIWYRDRVRKLDAVVVAQEIDRDYSASLEDVAIPAKWVTACKEIAGYINIPESGYGVAGFDVAAGGKAKSILIRRIGPYVQIPQHIKTDDLITGAGMVADLVNADGRIKLFNYDNIGVGLGTAAALKRMKVIARVQGVNVGERPSHAEWPDGKTSVSKFTNWKAELVWKLRDAIYKTYVTYLWCMGEGTEHYPPEELLVLPNHIDLTSQISYTRAFYTETGKIQIESKKQLATRGIASPDYFEALYLTFAEERGRVIVGKF